MLSAPAEKAIEDALRVGKAVLKFLAENDVRRPASHQYGVLLPKRCWRLFTPNAPVKGENKESSTRILWWDGTETDSCVHWYGRKKSEYRLTRFGRESFPHLTSHDTGSLLVLIPESHEPFTAYILDLDEDIDGVFEALNVEMLEDWGGFYDRDAIEPVPDNDTCVALRFRAYAQTVGDFPSTAVFSKITRSVVLECDPTFSEQSVDTQILELVRREYDLFKLVELVLCTNEVQGKVFPSVDQFIKTALTILNRRKSRAGRSLENHFADILHHAGIQFDVRAKIQGTPAFLFRARKLTTLLSTLKKQSLL